MKPQEQKYIVDQLDRLAIEALERSISADALDINLNNYLKEPQKELGRSPRHNRTNTAQSVIGGILSNIRLGSTRNLTDKTCEKIKIIFDDIEVGIRNGLFPDVKIEGILWVELGSTKANTSFDLLFQED
jgi:hypothetical protein